MEAARESTHRPPLIGFSIPRSVHQRFGRLGVIKSSPAHLKGGKIGLSILETARLKNSFNRKREYTYIGIVESETLNITWFQHQS